MDETRLQKKLVKLTTKLNRETFVFDLLRAYEFSKSRITRLQKGERVKSDGPGEITVKNKLFFKEVSADDDLYAVLEAVKPTLAHNPRIVFLTDYENVLAYDTKTEELFDHDLDQLPNHFDFFGPWYGKEKTAYRDENEADVKAADRMARIYDLIRKDNPRDDEQFLHDLNVFLSRLLFCYFAEDTQIFHPEKENLFSNGLASNTEKDGSDTQNYLMMLFINLNTVKTERDVTDHRFKDFPFVNGGLFRHRIDVPVFTTRSRRAIIEAGKLDWKAINPDIFGSMIQAVVDKDKRGGLGMHYTSVPNIMKVIEPLFLNDLRAAFTKARGGRYEKNDLKELRERLGKIKIFDPACGSGNFLIIAYKELRKLETEIIQRQAVLGEDAGAGKGLFEPGAGAVSTISLDQFYGIEIDDFAHEIAILALWLTEHQVNTQFRAEFGTAKPTLPLAESGQITHANACRYDWEVACPKEEGDETYVLGNPPYVGKKEQTREQKKDIALVFQKYKNFKVLDFVACWFLKASEYMSQMHRAAFVSTKSICQGEQVGVLWPIIYNHQVRIDFAHTTFMWDNNAKYNAAVAVVIVGISAVNNRRKQLFTKNDSNEDVVLEADLINPYLSLGNEIFVQKRSTPLSNILEVNNGSMANDGGYFFKTLSEYNLLSSQVKPYFRRVYGAREFFHDIPRYCLWLNSENQMDARDHEEIDRIVLKVEEIRTDSPRSATNKLASVSYRFGEVRNKEEKCILIPGLSAESRYYFPLDIMPSNIIVTNLAQAVYLGATENYWLFAVLHSVMNLQWIMATSGYFKKDLRYSPVLSYNTFPIPMLSDESKIELDKTARNIILTREEFPGQTLAELYDPDKMPEALREAHRRNDLAVERCYRPEPFESDEERLAWLFRLYEEMIAAERERDSLFAAAKKKSGKGRGRRKK